MSDDLKFMIQYVKYLKDAELTDIEKLGNPSFRNDLIAVMALDKADNDEDKKNFHDIWRADGVYKTIMIKKHSDKIVSLLEKGITGN